ncbi:MutS2 protein [Nitzschia inconspicua]|uniref:MutS2 protein n=1 Tax=Nitzschia inconspicua TaxID=303405 RepID=A0A9K3Q584_9STRA|nr:MutS2 protein [Nitzschia inconspicua]
MAAKFPTSSLLFGGKNTNGSPSFSSLASVPWIEDLNEEEQDNASFLSNGENGNTDSVSVRPTIDTMELLQKEICLRTDNPNFNVNSPKQVSLAIFGQQQTCTKRVLQQAAMDLNLPEDKRQLALLILKYKLMMAQQEPETAKETTSLETKKNVQLPNEDTVTTSSPSPATTHPLSEAKSNRHRKLLQHTQQSMMLSHEQIVETLFASPKSKVDPYWKLPLLQLSKPVARELLLQLNSELCPLGFDPDAAPRRKSALFSSDETGIRTAAPSIGSTAGRKGSFLSFVRDQKQKYPQCVTLVRCGDFYETYGTDAILLVEHVGLNSMGGKVRAGCPYRNIQSTLDGLTQHGFSVAVFEETGQVSSGTGNANKLKDRILTQIVSPASPTYLYDNWLLEGNTANSSGSNQSLEGLPPSRPCVGVIHTAAGYNMVEVSLEERSVQYSERLTAEAVACRLAAYPPADPLLYIPTPFEQKEASSKGSTPMPSFLPNPRSRLRGDTAAAGKSTEIVESYLGGFRVRTQVIHPDFVPKAAAGRSDAKRYTQVIVERFLDIIERHHASKDESGDRTGPNGRPLHKHDTADDFTVSMTSTSTNPLYVETATQLGLMNDKTIPSLIQYVLDEAAPLATRRFLQRYLLIPPPPDVAVAMSRLVGALMSPYHAASLPPLTVPNIGKVLSLIRAGQAGANVYGELLQSLATTAYILNENDGDTEEGIPLSDLLNLCQHESGLPAERSSLLNRCQATIKAIEDVVSTSYHIDSAEEMPDDLITRDENIPDSFFERNEGTWRGRVQPAVVSLAHQQVKAAATELCDAVKEDFLLDAGMKRNQIAHSINDNLFALKNIPSDKSTYFHPRDRNGKLLRNRWTTQRVENAMTNYINACEDATKEVSLALSSLADTLQDDGHVPAIVQSAHLNLILSVAFHHASKATKSGWQLAETIEKDQNVEGEGAHFVDVFPYWMERSNAISNTFSLSSMVLLTAPNMSGKSTLMRSTAAATLLTICGLCAPLSSDSRVLRFDTLFLRGASADVPAEDKSAFGAEMGDLSALFRCCGPNSFVFVDELARGTSPHDGTRLAGAVLEAMAERGMCGIFATHLHGIIDLPLKGRDRISLKRMAILHDDKNDRHDAESYEWTYRLEDGVCTDSLALVTADRFGLPTEIIQRAEELGNELGGYLSEKTIEPFLGEEKDVHSQTGDATLSKTDGRHNHHILSNRSDYKEEFQNIVKFANELIEETQSVAVPPNFLPPPNLCNRSCLYVLQLTKDPPSYYVGETDDLPQRLKQHRKKGGAWKHSHVAAFPLHDKTRARYWESSLIRELARSGYRLESTTDGRSSRQFRE